MDHLTTVREFPLFDGDFFPEHLKHLLAPPSAEDKRKGPPSLMRDSSTALVEKMKKKVKSVQKRFLVAEMAIPDEVRKMRENGIEPQEILEQKEITNDLFDQRAKLLGALLHHHWQFDELRRAHYSTMMLLAALGGPSS